MELTEREKLLIDCLQYHEIEMETIKGIMIMLMERPVGQNLLIQYLTSTKELTEDDIVSKTEEIIDKMMD